jgi:hypothetical protein
VLLDLVLRGDLGGGDGRAEFGGVAEEHVIPFGRVVLLHKTTEFGSGYRDGGVGLWDRLLKATTETGNDEI